jgi:NADH:ubiquinone oxidoreductase subunit 3 (subunit A)
LFSDYGYIGILLVIATLFTVAIPVIPVILRRIGWVPHKPSPQKYSTYECGMETVGNARVQFNFRYYIFAVFFVALDVLSVFLYPWAVNLTDLGLSGYVAVLVFFIIVMVAYVYAWLKGALEWK